MKSLLKVLGIILLVIIILIVGICAYLYISNKCMDVVIDDIPAYLAKNPLSAGERLSFDADDETMTILFDKGDFYWYIMNDYGREIINDLTDTIEDIDGVSLEGVGVNFSDGQISFDARIKYEFLPAINVSVPCELSRDGNHIALLVKGIKLFGITIPIEKLPIDAEDRTLFETDYSPALLESIDKIEICDSGIKITGPLAVNFMGMARSGFEKEQLERMTEDERCNYAAQILLKYEEDPEEGKKLLMNLLEDSPELFPTIYCQLLSVIKREAFNNFYPQTSNHGFLYRICPEYDQDKFGDISDELHSEY